MNAVSLASHLPDKLGWTGDHDLLRMTARRLLSERCPIREVRRLAGDPVGFDRALWRELAELGWTGLHLPERVGGAGLDSLSMALVLEEAGRALYPGPLLEVALAGLAIARAGAAEQVAGLLPEIAAGRTIATIALVEGASSWQLDAVAATAEPALGGGHVLFGEKVHVPWAQAADLLIAPFREGGGLTLFAVPLAGEGIEIEPEVPLDPTRRIARVRMNGARVPAGARLSGGGGGEGEGGGGDGAGGDGAGGDGAGGDGGAVLGGLLAPALTYLAAELVGAAGA
ncbi:MAG TPA: acyl-CoA dehydrogenase family protein, partial [Kofleriaceae bacterium]|nr:acyl-CoA dehydrogenase family protein [Kofleriaceae bacterium]